MTQDPTKQEITSYFQSLQDEICKALEISFAGRITCEKITINRISDLHKSR